MSIPKQEVTRKRRLHTRFDVVEPVLLQPGYWRHRHAKDLAMSAAAVKSNVVLRGQLCWQLQPVQADLSTIHEQSAHQDAIMRPGTDYQMPSGWHEADINRDTSDQPNSMNGSVGAASSSDPFIQMDVGAGVLWDDSSLDLAADKAAFPGVGGTSVVVMDRRLVTYNVDNGSEGLYLRWSISGGTLSAKSLLLTWYVGGPQSSWGPYDGLGQYCVEYYGDGRAKLKQYCKVFDIDGTYLTSIWADFAEFRYAPQNQVADREHYLNIVRHRITPPRGNLLGVMDFYTTTGGSGSTVKPGGNTSILAGPIVSNPENVLSFQARWRTSRAVPTPSYEKQRIDTRRNMRPKLQISKAKFPSDGYLFDDPEALTSELGLGDTDLDRYLYVTAFGDFPTHTSLDIALYKFGQKPSDTPAYTPIASGTIGTKGVWKAFLLDPSDALPTVQRLIKFHTDDKFVTPSLYGIRTSKKAYISLTEATPFEIDGTYDLEVTGPSPDPTHESAHFMVHDFDAEWERLRRRGAGSVEISTEYDASPAIDWTDSANDVYRPVIFRGYFESPKTGYEGVTDPQGRYKDQSDDYRQVALSCIGMHVRGSEEFSSQLIDFGYARDEDITAGRSDLAWKVTDVIRYALRSEGWPDSCIDVPDIDLRIFTNDNDGIRINPGQSWVDFRTELAKQYLDAIVVFDANASSSSTPSEWYGMQRLILPPTPSTTRPLAYFAIKKPGSPSGQWSPAADPDTWKPITYLGRSVPGTFIVKHSNDLNIDPPVANIITVISGQADGNGRKHSVAPNVFSYRAVGGQSAPDADNEDYVGRRKPLTLVDSQLQNELTFIADRLYNILGHARKTFPIIAPLIFITDELDTLQRRPRQLRVGDEVVVFDKNANPYKAYCLSCNPIVVKDVAQMAHYELLFPPQTAMDIEL